MKKILLLSLFFCSMFYSLICDATSNENSLDQIVAVVNEDVITKSELNHALSITKTQITSRNMATPPENILRKQVLDQLINKQLQLQMAQQMGIDIPDEDIDNAVSNVALRNNMTVDELYQRLTREGMTKADYRKEMREQLTMQKLQQQDVVSHITITKEEVDTFMHSQAWQNNDGKEYHLEDILISLSDTPSSEEIAKARQHATDIITRLHHGQSFREAAMAESGDKHALQGGDLGWRKLPEIPSAFANLVANMRVKEVAGPIQTPNGFHIIRLTETRNAGKQAAPDRKQVEDLLLQRKFEEAVQNWVSKLRSQAFIEMTPTKSAA